MYDPFHETWTKSEHFMIYQCLENLINAIFFFLQIKDTAMENIKLIFLLLSTCFITNGGSLLRKGKGSQDQIIFLGSHRQSYSITRFFPEWWQACLKGDGLKLFTFRFQFASGTDSSTNLYMTKNNNNNLQMI